MYIVIKFLELIFKEMKGNGGNFFLFKLVFVFLESGCLKFLKYVFNVCIDLCFVVEMVFNIY